MDPLERLFDSIDYARDGLVKSVVGRVIAFVVIFGIFWLIAQML